MAVQGLDFRIQHRLVLLDAPKLFLKGVQQRRIVRGILFSGDFDEDGYESWTLTALDVSTYSINTEYQQTDGISDYFSAYAARGIFGEDFEQKCRDAAEDIRDIQFSVSALYAGDEAPVEVAHGKEIMMLIDSDGCWVFG